MTDDGQPSHRSDAPGTEPTPRAEPPASRDSLPTPPAPHRDGGGQERRASEPRPAEEERDRRDTAAGGTPSGGFPSVGTPSGGVPRVVERRRRATGWKSGDILRATALVSGFLIFLRLAWAISPLLLTAFLGLLFGLAVEAGVDRLQRFRIPRGLGAAIIVLGFYGLLTGVGAWIAPTIREQGRELRSRLPEAVDKVEGWINAQRSGFLGVVLGGSEVAQRRDTAAAVPATAEDSAAALPGGGETPTSTLRERLGSQVSGVGRYLFPFLSSTVAVFGGILLITVLAIYIGADPDTYHRGLMHLFPHHSRARAGEVLSAMALVLRKWLVTQLIAMLSIGVITTVVLLALDVKAAFALGLIAGLLEFVPTIGPILSAVPAVAMGFLDSPEKALYVVIAYVLIQQLENHILIPKLMQGGLDLPPVLTILGQALMAIVFGFLGLMVAVPLVAALMVPIKLLYVEDVVGDEVTILEEDDG
jgi:predicted PurR-regulated permease PerM